MTEAQNTSSVKKYYLGTFDPYAYSSIPSLGRTTDGLAQAIHNLIQKEFGISPATCQFRAIVKPEESLDAIVEAGTDVPERDYTWATLPLPDSHVGAAIYHAYARSLSPFLPNQGIPHLIAVIAYKASELVPAKDGASYKYTFRTSPKEAFVALLYFHVKLLELHP